MRKSTVFLVMILMGWNLACSDNKEKSHLPVEPNVPDSETDSREMDSIHSASIEFNKKQKEIEEKHNIKIDLPLFEKSPQAVHATKEKTLLIANEALDALAKTPTDSLSFENTIGRMDDIIYRVVENHYRIGLLAEVSPDMEIKKAAKEAGLEMSQWFTKIQARRDIYNIIKAYAETKPVLEGEKLRLFHQTMKSYTRVGFHLEPEKFKEVLALREELADLTDQISTNIGLANKETITFNDKEALGIPQDLLDGIPKNEDGLFEISPGIFNQYAVFNVYSPLEATRKKAFTARQQRAMVSNEKLMEKVVKIRAKLADLLGYPNWADYKTELRMAGNGQRALDFIQNLSDDISPKFQDELDELKKLKVADTGDTDAVIEAWDFRYFLNEYKKREFNVDTNQLKKYFEYNNTLNGMFHFFEDIFRLKIKEVKAPYVWAENVDLVLISDSQSGKPLGYLYLDMFPRPETEKYGHFAHFTIRPGKRLEDGTYRRPVSSLVCNFPKAANGKPSLLTLDNVETLFHEFGHALHALLTTANFHQFAGTSVPRDFVEAPSQMLEYFVLDKEVLDRFAHNYQDPLDKIPAHLLESIKKANLSTVATAYRRQFAFGIMDLRMHREITPDQENLDLISFTNQILKDVFLAFPEDTAQVASFGHLWGGYDAGYYGYAWADNVAADLASIFEKSNEGYTSQKIGMRLRQEIYEVGDTRDVNESIRQFLGRELSNESFLEKLGLKK